MRQWGTWRTLDERYGTEIGPMLSEMILRPSTVGLSEPIAGASWTHMYIATLNIVFL